MAEFYAVPHSEMEEFLRQRRFVPVELSYRNRPVKEWVYERKLPRSPGHWVRVYTGINRYGRNAGDSRKSGKDAIRVQVIYRDGLGETLVSQPKRVHRVSGWAENLDKRLKEVAEKLPRVAYDSRGQPMTLRKGKSGYFWGSRDYPRYKETRPFQAESEESEFYAGVPIYDINSMEELTEIFESFRGYAKKSYRSNKRFLNTHLLRINFSGVYSCRVISNPSKIVFGMNMLDDLKKGWNAQQGKNILWKKIGNYTRIVSADTPFVPKNNEATLEELITTLDATRHGWYAAALKRGPRNLLIFDMKGIIFALDHQAGWERPLPPNIRRKSNWRQLSSGMDKLGNEIEILGGIPPENIVYETLPSEPYNYADAATTLKVKRLWKAEESAPLAGQTTEAPYEIKVYVPSTDLDQPVSETEFQSRIDETQEKLSELFGGFTTTVGDGGYLSQEEGLISEPVMIVTTWANPEEYLGKLAELEDFLQQKQQDWGQEVIGFEFENDFFMFPEFSAEGDPEWMKSPEKKREIFLKLQKEDGVPRICEVCESAYSGLYRYPEDDEIFVVCRDCVKQSELEWGDMFGFKPDWTGERGGKPLSVINTKSAPDMSAGSVLLISGAIGFAMGIILGR